MWYEYPIATNFEKQKEVIRGLRTFIQSLEAQKSILGFAFDHYYNNPDEQDELRIRFEFIETEELPYTERGLGGFGSTGKG